MTGVKNKYHGKSSEESDEGKTLKLYRTAFLLRQIKSSSADITQVQEHFFLHLRYISKMERGKLKEKLSWDEIRNLILHRKKKIHYGENCRKCVWADTRSGKILCSRYQCVKERK
ncbi:MAG: hypothetical protein ACLT3J_06700 [Ruminococcus sp.]